MPKFSLVALLLGSVNLQQNDVGIKCRNIIDVDGYGGQLKYACAIRNIRRLALSLGF